MSLMSLSSVLILYIEFLEYHPLDLFQFKNRKREERFLKTEDVFGKAESVRQKLMLPKAHTIVSGLMGHWASLKNRIE